MVSNEDHPSRRALIAFILAVLVSCCLVLLGLTVRWAAAKAAQPNSKEVEERLKNMEETYGRAEAESKGQPHVSRRRALKIGRSRLRGLRESLYEGLAGDRAVAMWDWTGTEQKERGDIRVVAVTSDRVVIWNGGPTDWGDRGLHPRIKEVSLEGVDVDCWWVVPGGSFVTALVDSRTRQVLHFWTTPDWNGYAPDLRLAVAEMRRKAHFARYTLPVIAQFLVAATLIATVVGLLVTRK